MYLDQNLPANRITVSSDCGGCLPVFDADGVMTHMDIGGPGELLVTVQRLVKAGRELSDVLPAFTSNPAQLLRLQNKGCLRSGADADLVVLDDALEIQGVMALGKWHVRNGEVVLKGTFEK
jgi:beta-aspartyl-dipeptidase (metallo-type)